jgi:hypothetical protein
VKDFPIPQVRAWFSAGWLPNVAQRLPTLNRIGSVKHFLSDLLLTKCISGHSRATHPRSWIHWIEKYSEYSRIIDTPDASGFDFFSVFFNPQRSVGSEHKFYTKLLVAYTTTAASLWF